MHILVCSGGNKIQKDTCRKSYVMRPLGDQKSCEQHLVANFEFEQSVEANNCYEQMVVMEAVFWGSRSKAQCGQGTAGYLQRYTASKVKRFLVGSYAHSGGRNWYLCPKERVQKWPVTIS